MPLIQQPVANRIDAADASDSTEIARLLLQLYREEAPGMVPRKVESFVALLEAGLRAHESTLASSLVARSDQDPSRLVGHIALSCDHNPRTTPFSPDYLRLAVRRLGVRPAARVLWRQYRLMGLLCAALGPKTAQLHSLIVDPDHRGEGVAVELVRCVEDEARRNEQEAILLYILAGNPVEEFYRRLGYRRVHLPRPQHPMPHSGIAMQRVLD